jgi:predicted house-cleaning noncanonical NTP pyrophosphatase (MazG superfamily)
MGRLTVRFTDGNSASQDVIDTNVPIGKTSSDAVVKKFLTLGSYLLENKQAQKVIEIVRTLEELRDVSELTRTMISGRPASKPNLRAVNLRDRRREIAT